MSAPQVKHRLTVALVQWASTLEPADNRAALERLDADADLVVLPEAFARDFGPPTDRLGPYAEPLDGPFATALEATAARLDATVVAGMFEQTDDAERPCNTLLARGRAHSSYQKVHLYDSFGYKESERLLAGPWEPTVVDVDGWKVGLLTCYDLRFPELARALVDRGAEVLVIPAAWVAGRTPDEHARKQEHWRTLVRARAIENTTYVVAVGQPEPRYTGCSVAVDPDGVVLAEAGPHPVVLHATLERERLEQVRATNPSLANRRTPGG